MAPPHPRVLKAYTAMECLGISSVTVRPILEHLLKLYNWKWELIEEDNYRTLADAIFESLDQKGGRNKLLREQKRKIITRPEEQEPPPKRSHSGKSEDKSSSTTNSGKTMGLEAGETRKTLTTQRSMRSAHSGERNKVKESNTNSHQTTHGYNAKGPMSSNIDRSASVKAASQKVSCSSDSKRRMDEAQVTDIQTKNKRDEEMNHIARPPPSVQQKIMDITKGAEKVKIPLVDEVGIKLPKFIYIPQNTIYQDAYVPFSLARIADDNCCHSCTGDCLSLQVPCACSRETGGEFAYTPQGLLKEEFLGACISMNCEPQKHHLFYCQNCPLERAKNVQNPEPCKGHVLRKFIKECWRKCGCSMECGNRVVQRGITCSVQVFSTQGKGWGLRALEDLPKGTFVCEYVGEILTNTELYERNKQIRKNERNTYPVYLDADWGSEQILKDEEALCLDATCYGNVARFINHRCFDANLLEIPVEVETPDHHYYHIAFFTKRNVDAYEELTWDYGIDFDDDDHPIKAFECRCASTYCRDTRRKGQRHKYSFLPLSFDTNKNV